MPFLPDDFFFVERSGKVRPATEGASQKLQARAGRYALLASPANVLWMAKAHEDGSLQERRCLLSGVVRPPSMVRDVLALLAQGGHEGELQVLSDEGSRSIFLEHGCLVGADSTVPRERLGEVLYRSGALSREQIERCVEVAAQGKMRLFEATVRTQLLSREKLFALMRRRAEEVLWGMLAAEEGTFHFVDGYEAANAGPRLSVALAPMLADAPRRMAEWEELSAFVPSFDMAMVPTGEALVDSFGIAQALAQAPSGSLTLEDVLRATGATDFQLLQTIVPWIRSGALRLAAAKLDLSSAFVAFNQAMAAMLQRLDAIDAGEDLRDQLPKLLAEDPVLCAIFAGAGPQDDGTVDWRRVQQNLTDRSLPGDAEQQLPGRMHAFALAVMQRALPTLEASQGASLRERVHELIAPLAAKAASPSIPVARRGAS